MEKDYMNLDQLQNLCDKLNLSSDGTKRELIERLDNYIHPNSSNSSSSIPRTCEKPTPSTSEMTTPANTTTTTTSTVDYWFNAVLKSLFALGIVAIAVGLMMLLNQTEEKIEIIVKRPWFN